MKMHSILLLPGNDYRAVSMVIRLSQVEPSCHSKRYAVISVLAATVETFGMAFAFRSAHRPTWPQVNESTFNQEEES